jgi:hypothetical protein
MSRFRSRKFLKMLPGIVVALALITMLVQFVFKLPPLSIPMSGGMQRYSSQSGHVSILYPSGWFVLDGPAGNESDPSNIASIAYPKFPPLGPDVVIYHSKVEFHLLAEVTAWGEELAQRALNYTKISSESVLISGEEMIQEEFTKTIAPSPFQPNPLRRCLTDYRLHNQHGYVLVFCADTEDYSQLRPVFQQMIESFNYLD